MIEDLMLTTKEHYYIKANDLENEGKYVDLDWMNWLWKTTKKKRKKDCVQIWKNKNFKMNVGKCSGKN